MFCRIAVLLLCAASAWSEAQQYALVIGIAGYPGFPENPLKWTARDAFRFAGFLGSPEGGNIPAEHILLLTNGEATRDGIERAIKKIATESNIEDSVHIFFSGHSQRDREGHAYLMPWDGKPSNPKSRGIEATRFLKSIASTIRAKEHFVYLDTCYAAAAVSRGDDSAETGATAGLIQAWRQELASRGLHMTGLLAASANQKAFEDDERGEGRFTGALIDGLTGEADENSDGKVTAEELRAYVTDRVSKATGGTQTPIPMPDFDAGAVLSIVEPELTMLDPQVKTAFFLAETRLRNGTPQEAGNAIRELDKLAKQVSGYQTAVRRLFIQYLHKYAAWNPPVTDVSARDPRPGEVVQEVLSALGQREWKRDLDQGDRYAAPLDFTIDLSHLDLRGADLKGAWLNGADLSASHLENAILEDAHLEAATLNGAVLDSALLTQAYLKEVRANNATFRRANLSGAELMNAEVTGSHFEGAILDGARMIAADTDGASFERASLRGVDLESVSLTETNLQEAHVEGARLEPGMISQEQLDLTCGDRATYFIVHAGGRRLKRPMRWTMAECGAK